VKIIYLIKKNRIGYFKSKLTLNHPSLIDKKKKGDGGYGLEKREERKCFSFLQDFFVLDEL